MRKLTFEPIFDTSVTKIWQLFTQVEDYPKYIKFCQKAELSGPFAKGSHWTDRSTVMIVPLDIDHQIVTVEPEKKLEYKIGLPGKGELWQRFNFSEEFGKAKILVQIEINFKNKLLDSLLGGFLSWRNQIMIEQTIRNFHERLDHETA